MANDIVKLNDPWELGNFKANTSSLGKQEYEEPFPLFPHVTPDKQYGQPLPNTLPVLAFGETSGVVSRFRVAMTLDNSVPGQETWFAKTPWESGWSSSVFVDSEMMPRWLTPADRAFFGFKFFGGNNGDTEIPMTDNSGPVFTARAGMGRFTNGGRPLELGTSPANSIWLEGYYYSGLMLDEVLSMGVGAGGREVLKGPLIGVKDGVNTDFTLPASIDYGGYFEIRLSGLPLDPDDYVITNGVDITLSVSPTAVQYPDIVYYPVS